MLENWLSSASILKIISRHYKTGVSLNDDEIRKMNDVKNVNQALYIVGQLQLALFDMKIHTDYNGTSEADLLDLWNSMKHDIALADSSPHNTAGFCSFAHIMDGYEAGYYGYLYSKVFASDMFAARFAGHELDSEIGSSYRDIVLKPGGSRDSLDSLTQFLNRAPNSEAFLRELGLQTEIVRR